MGFFSGCFHFPLEKREAWGGGGGGMNDNNPQLQSRGQGRTLIISV